MDSKLQTIENFVGQIARIFRTGEATEHSYRAALQQVLAAQAQNVSVLNEPRRVECGAPDLFVHRAGIVVGHVEAKDVGVDIRRLKGANKEQQDRYRGALPNLIYTNGLDWDFYRDGERVAGVQIATLEDDIDPHPESFEKLSSLLQNFVDQKPQTITRPSDLAKRMAGKARLIKDVLFRSIEEDHGDKAPLVLQYEAFKENLIHDISKENFADIYAETIVYGMFAARLHDNSLDTFSRQEALELLPKSNPFLKSLFSFIAGNELDDEIVWIIDDLAEVFQACDVAKIMNNFGSLTGKKDPFLHFYETFLFAYNPKKRKARGVWYTPEPLVNFIVNAVNDVLVREFGIEDGLADTSKVTIDWDTGQKETTKSGKIKKSGKNAIIEKEVHRLQILDPATGTGTFLAEVVKQIAPRIKDVAPGMWSSYVEQDLIPRLHGFELLMASYAMCHMKLDMILSELDYVPSASPPRLSVYLTNSLEEGEPANQTLPFARWISSEAKGANAIKREMPVMCIIGNPPYLGEGGVSDDWIGELLNDYKKEPGGKIKLQERNPKWLNDLYVKFMRLASHLLEKNGEGVFGFVTNHGYLDNPTFRGMRWHLLKTFDRLWILDLHGNTKKKEIVPNGKTDQNVFEIQQGVSIIIAAKTRQGSRELAEVFHRDLWGKRNEKYEALLDPDSTGLKTFKPIEVRPPRYFFKPWDYEAEAQWEKGFSIKEMMPVHSNGIVTGKDKVLIASDKETLRNQVMEHYGGFDSQFVEEISYRPFDSYFIYNDSSKVARNRRSVMRNYAHSCQIGLLFSKQVRDRHFAHAFVTQRQSEAIFLSGATATNAMNAPLFLYPEEGGIYEDATVNFDEEIHNELLELVADERHGKPQPLQIFDYIYGVLYCPDYRETFGEFLKADYPRIPWPNSPEEFWSVSGHGKELRLLHLMESSRLSVPGFQFSGDGEGMVRSPRFDNEALH